nr:E3 ubiquitin-protein ligase TRIM69-like isoform X2 [Pogona vitticeps]
MAQRSQEQSLREELTCAICFDLFRNPVMLECMHHFCQECIQSYWNSCSDVATCPQCRQEFPTRSFRRQYLVSGVVEKVRRCSSEDYRRKMQKHLQEALRSYQTERQKLMRMRHETEDNIRNLTTENMAIRPAVQVEALSGFSTERHRDLYDGPLQYIFWRRMLKSISPVPAPLTLDPETAHPNLILSNDLTAVTESEKRQPVPRSPSRFLQSVNVLGKTAFESGRHYWEVWVGNKTKWDLGVAADSVDRTARVKLCPENGYWAVRLREPAQYWAAATPWVRLEPRRSLKKVGILLDCGANKVAFYDAEDMSFLFAFHQVRACKFYPFFSTCLSSGKKNAEPIRICRLNL